MEKAQLNVMFDNLLHIGNKTNFWNTKMKPYIYGSVNGIHVINLVETAKKLEDVKTQLKHLTSSGKKVLIVATKIQSREAFKKLAQDTGSYYVCETWVPGLLTNFKTIKRRIWTYLQLLQDSQSGAFSVLTKKEKATRMLELEKLDKAYSGLKDLKKLPDVILASDGMYEAQALKEATTLGILSFAIMNTNGDIDAVTDLIPANTNSPKSFDYIAQELKSSFLKASNTETKATVQKIEHKKVSGEKKTTKVEETQQQDSQEAPKNSREKKVEEK